MTFKLFMELCCLFVVLFTLGTVASLPAYHWQLSAFFASKLWVKITWWLPIFAIFCLVLTLGAWSAWLVVAGLLVQACREIRQSRSQRVGYVWLYALLVTAGLCHLPRFFSTFSYHQAVAVLVGLCLASVLSDVFAFFMGTYFGRHHLPTFLNNNKSYEGVAGQIIGAMVGLAIVSMLPEIAFSWAYALSIGCASALGDLTNSAVKRQHRIKDWGDTIPGHGGVLDRFASLSFALAAGYWCLQLLG